MSDEIVLKNEGLGKSKLGLIVCVILIAILGFSTLLLFIQAESLRTSNNTLSNQKTGLLNQLDDLQSELDSVQDKYDSLQTTYLSYVVDHQYSDTEYWDYVYDHLYTNEEYADSIDDASFAFYYFKPENQKLGVYNLDDELSSVSWSEPYEANVFDCSEMSGCLEWWLENRGWHAKIYVGDSPFSSGKHAWLIVETSDGNYMPVEATTIRVVWWDDPYFDNYWEYDYRFETIQEAIDYYESEFDWWELGFCPLDS